MLLSRRSRLLWGSFVALLLAAVAVCSGPVRAEAVVAIDTAATSCTPAGPPAAAGSAAAKKAADAKRKTAAAKKKKQAAAAAKRRAAAAKKKAAAARKSAAAERSAGRTSVNKTTAAKQKAAAKNKAAAKKKKKKGDASRLPVTKAPAKKAPVKKPATCAIPALPLVPGASSQQPGPVAAVPDAPLVPSTQRLGRTSASYFGVHGTPTAAALNGFASIRLWDTGTTWADLEPARGVWNWAPLDAVVQKALSQGFSPLLVLGQTPAWASSDPSAPGVGRPGASMPPSDLGLWSAYVKAVAARYTGRIAAYEIWNEPNFVGDYFHGDEATLARMTALAHDAVKSADPAALLVSPGFATRTKGQLGWAYRYFDAIDIADIDVISLHLYPMPQQLPEDAVGQLQSVVDALRKRGISKPVWNTEVNYGVTGGVADAVPVPDPLGGAFIARTLLADRAAGIDRVFWYSWGTARILGISVDETSAGLTPAAQSWMRVAGWLTSSTLVGCSVADGIHACSLRPDSGGWAQVLWSEADGRQVNASKGSTATVGLYGTVQSVSSGGAIPVGSVPVLVVGGGANAQALASATPRG